MSYNIGSIAIVASDGFRVSIAALAQIRAEFTHVPDGNMFDNSVCWEPAVDDGYRYPKWISWHGEGSGSLYDDLLRVLALFEGSADLVLTWESGDSFSGLRVKDGVVTRHKVLMVLGEEEPA